MWEQYGYHLKVFFFSFLDRIKKNENEKSDRWNVEEQFSVFSMRVGRKWSVVWLKFASQWTHYPSNEMATYNNQQFDHDSVFDWSNWYFLKQFVFHVPWEFSRPKRESYWMELVFDLHSFYPIYRSKRVNHRPITKKNGIMQMKIKAKIFTENSRTPRSGVLA